MKNVILSASLALLLAAGQSCKDKKAKDTEVTPSPIENQGNSTPTTGTPPAPVDVASDDALRNGVRDATKDVAGLTTRVENGVIYLTGSISKEDNMRITPTLMSLKPKSVNRDGLTIK